MMLLSLLGPSERDLSDNNAEHSDKGQPEILKEIESEMSISASQGTKVFDKIAKINLKRSLQNLKYLRTLRFEKTIIYLSKARHLHLVHAL